MQPVVITVADGAWRIFGAHVEGEGVRFAVWAPHATAVGVIGDFNDWIGDADPLTRDDQGIWHGTVEGIGEGELYQFDITAANGDHLIKSDPFARFAQLQPQRSSVVHLSTYEWADDDWMAARPSRKPHAEPMSIYEVHLGSWKRNLSYRELAVELVAYVQDLGFTHIEFMPVMEHPFVGSWGYQVTGFFAPTSRHGDPDDFRALVDAMHQAGIGVIIDWVPAHFPKDEWALGRFDGQSLYEPAEFDEHPDWGTYTFDFGKREVRNFLHANALYWLEEFHVDGLRVDAVASMLYLDYSRGKGQWKPNHLGGRENLDAISFLEELNVLCHRRHPGIAMIAEDSTAWTGVTTPVHEGGLGFSFKWNLGWMHDTLNYLHEDPIARQHHHRQMTFAMVYAHSDNYLLPLSHDEVVHGKGSLVRKMPGDRAEQLANLRSYLAFMWAHPGKQLLFMGSEFGQDREWSEKRSLDWDLLDEAAHAGVQQLVRDLNTAYRDHRALWETDYERSAFRWIEPNDNLHNVFSFVRFDSTGRPLVCISNFAGVDHDAYDVGLPWSGTWTSVINTSARAYGGNDPGAGKAVIADDMAHQGYPASATVHLPALGTIWLTSEAPTPVAGTSEERPRPWTTR